MDVTDLTCGTLGDQHSTQAMCVTCSQPVRNPVHNSDDVPSSRARGRTGSHTGNVNPLMESYDSRPRKARTRKRTHARGSKPPEQFEQWRRRKFGGDFDPVLDAVNEAVAKFGGGNPDRDHRIWLTVANRIGADEFRRKIADMDALIESYRQSNTTIGNKAKVFQSLLNGRTKHGKQPNTTHNNKTGETDNDNKQD